ncbi:MAG TPA: hypothetical protein VFY60_06735 [Pyrinomonadaceae bacterium]|nr:hypothetical protein [Pyrinomonadaceae bacterium]
MSKFIRKGTFTGLLVLLALVLATDAFAQGRGRGGGAGSGRGGGGGSSSRGGPPAGTGVDRGVGNASERSGGRSDDGLSNASTRSKGRSDDGIERARRSNLRRADDDLRNHPRLPRALHTNANDLRAGYQAALATNPDLKFGHYVSATRLSQNLNSRFPNVTREAILDGLASGRSLGQTLQDLGLNEREEKEARKRADAEIKAARKNN